MLKLPIKTTEKVVFTVIFMVAFCSDSGCCSRSPGAVHFCRSWSSHLNSGEAGAGATLLLDSSQLLVFSVAFRFSLKLFLISVSLLNVKS